MLNMLWCQTQYNNDKSDVNSSISQTALLRNFSRIGSKIQVRNAYIEYKTVHFSERKFKRHRHAAVPSVF